MKKKILFVGHSAGHTGAPLILLRLCKWLKENSNLSFEIILKEDGKLRPLYEKIAPVLVYKQSLSETSLKSRGYRFLAQKSRAFNSYIRYRMKKYMRKKYPPSSYSLIFSNTLTNGEILSDLAHLKCPVICRVAELDFWINKSGKENFERIKKHVTKFIAVSEAVKQNLVANHNIANEKIEVIHGFIDPPEMQTNPQSVRANLNIPQDAIIVGGSGAEIWRKGKDLFILLAIAVHAKAPDLPIHFVWVGGIDNAAELYQLQHDIKQSCLENSIHLVPEVTNPFDYFASFDIFAMMSREDPYPIVNLESASLGKPIICFANAGGSSELVEEDAGFVVPYLDIDTMANRVIELAKDENLRKRTGERAAQKVRERHDISVAATKILKVIKQFL